MIIQVIVIGFSIFVISRVVLRFREKKISLLEFITWTLLWIVIPIVVLLPQTTAVLAKLVGVGRGADAIIYLSIIVIFYGLFRLYVKQEHIEHEITQIVRKLALKTDYEKHEKKDDIDNN